MKLHLFGAVVEYVDIRGTPREERYIQECGPGICARKMYRSYTPGDTWQKFFMTEHRMHVLFMFTSNVLRGLYRQIFRGLKIDKELQSRPINTQ
jgi:hypothetical protein